MRRLFKATALAVCFFTAVYAPAFLITALVRPTITAAIPIVIIISLGVSVLIMIALSKRPQGLAEFGFRLPQPKYVWLCLAFGAVLGLVTGYVTYLFPTKPPYDVSKFTPTLNVLYFVLGASVQEEVIFRGLLQTTIARISVGCVNVFGITLGAEVVVIATLFCLIHIPEGPAVALSALLLGLFAGEFRKRSGSLVPAMLVHMLFNASSAIFGFLPRLSR